MLNRVKAWRWEVLFIGVIHNSLDLGNSLALIQIGLASEDHVLADIVVFGRYVFFQLELVVDVSFFLSSVDFRVKRSLL